MCSRCWLVFLGLAAAACGEAGDEAAVDRTSGVIRGAIRYDGSLTGEIEVAVFPSFPPRGVPLSKRRLAAGEAEQSYTLDPIAPGRYFVLAMLDSDADDGDNFHPAVDPGGAYGGYYAPISVTVGQEGAPDIDIHLYDPSSDTPWIRPHYR